MSDHYFNERTDAVNFPRQYPEFIPSREYGLGMPEIIRVEDIRRLYRVLRTGDFGWCKTAEEWIEWNVHPAFEDEALEIVAKFTAELQSQQEVQP